MSKKNFRRKWISFNKKNLSFFTQKSVIFFYKENQTIYSNLKMEKKWTIMKFTCIGTEWWLGTYASSLTPRFKRFFENIIARGFADCLKRVSTFYQSVLSQLAVYSGVRVANYSLPPQNYVDGEGKYPRENKVSTTNLVIEKFE